MIDFLIMELTNTIADRSRNPHLNIRLAVGICHPDDLVSRTRFRTYIDFVLPDEIQEVSSIYVEFHNPRPQLRGVYQFEDIGILW